MRTKRVSGALDPFRLIAAFLVVANHTSPLLSLSEDADFILTRIVARVAVPFFLMVSGYFLATAFEQRDHRHLLKYGKKIVLLYGLSIVLFLPLNLYAGHYSGKDGWIRVGKDVLFNGTFYHLWYLPGLLTGMLLVYLLRLRLGQTQTLLITVILYGIGLFGDSYYGIAVQFPFLNALYDGIFGLFDYTRNGIFMVPIFLMMGMILAKRTPKQPLPVFAVGLTISFGLLLAEGLWLRSQALQRHDSMYVMLIPTMFCLFACLLKMRGRVSKLLRDLSMIIYIVHPWMIVLVRLIAKWLHLENLLVANQLLHFLAVSLFSLLLAVLVSRVQGRRQTCRMPVTDRAWVEVDLKALAHNARVLKGLLPQHALLMAILKANAYGHGAVQVARTLSREGIRMFAVATLAEGIQLRKYHIRGDILILGYTPPEEIHLIRKYRLTQTVIDATHAKALDARGVRIRVQLKIDTGMHRLGIDADNHLEIAQVFGCKYLKVVGVYSHLSVADSLEEQHIQYTKQQMERFDRALHWMNSQGYSTGTTHIQASYGLLNYPETTYDLVRAGIALYGAVGHGHPVRSHVTLQPVLAIRARVATVKWLKKGECAGYGQAFTAREITKMAVVTIGYADGIPRQWSNGYVLIHGQKAPIIGTICMDQLLVDVSHIADVKVHDRVTLIGKDGEEQITCEDMARQCGTIPNEILSRLGPRLGYVYLNSKNAVEKARQIKPEIPLIGNNGISIRDEIELIKVLH